VKETKSHEREEKKSSVNQQRGEKRKKHTIQSWLGLGSGNKRKLHCNVSPGSYHEYNENFQIASILYD
jgi:hypothetical protein